MTDFNPFLIGTYYRIKQINNDGTYHNYTTILVNTQGERNILIYPNPAQHTVNLSIHSIDESLIDYEVKGLTGILLWSGSLPLSVGENIHQIIQVCITSM